MKDTILKERQDGHGFTIDAVVAFVSVDKNGEEGIIALNAKGAPMPAICADMERFNLIKPMIEEMAKFHKFEYKIVELSQRREL